MASTKQPLPKLPEENREYIVCKYCQYIIRQELKCVKCFSMFHSECAKYMENVKTVGENNIICCETDAKESVDLDDYFADTLFIRDFSDNDIKIRDLEIRSLKRQLKDKEELIVVQKQLIKILEEQNLSLNLSDVPMPTSKDNTSSFKVPTDQIQKEVEREQINIDIINIIPSTSRKDDSMSDGADMGSMSLNRKVNRGDTNVTSPIHRDKLVTEAVLDEESGSLASYVMRNTGSQNLMSSAQQLTNASNSALNNFMDSDKRLAFVTAKPKQNVPNNNQKKKEMKTNNQKNTATSVSQSLQTSSKSDKNNASSKANKENINKIQNKLPYQDGQWTPTNPSGLKVYQKDFLLALRDSSSSKIKPEKILKVVAANDRGQHGDGWQLGSQREPPEVFGSMASFNMWGKGSQRVGSSPSNDPSTSKDRRIGRICNKSDGQGSKSSAPQLFALMPCSGRISENQMEIRINNSIDDYISSNGKLEKVFSAISGIPISYYPKIISTSYLHVLEKSQHDRLKTGELFAKLVKDRHFSLEDYCTGLEDILVQVDDLKIDIPKFWDCLAEILVAMVTEEVVPLDRLFDLLKKLGESDISKLLTCLFKLIVANKGLVFLQKLWQDSGLRLNDFLENARVKSFVEDTYFGFLFVDSASATQKQLFFEEIQEQMSALLREKASHDEIFSWITENVGDKVKEKRFIRTLVTTILEDSISPNFKLQRDIFLSHANLFLKYVHNNLMYELEGLYALQALIHKLGHPLGLLLEICTILLDLLIFSQESFLVWEQSNDPVEQEGKGMAIKQLIAFIIQLKEDDDDDDDSSVEDD